MTETVTTLVPFDRAYVPKVLEWIRNDELRDAVGTIVPPSDAQHERWYESLQADGKRVTFVVEDEGAPVGLVGLFDLHATYRRAELFVYVARQDARRKGVGAAAVRRLVDFAFQSLGLHRVYVHVWGFNAPAFQFFQKIGFVVEGLERAAVFKRGRFHDVHVLSVLQSEWSGT